MSLSSRGLNIGRAAGCSSSATSFAGAVRLARNSPASTSGRGEPAVCRRRGHRHVTSARLIGAGNFDPAQLTYEFKGVLPTGPSPILHSRWYTCTHNDFSGDVALTIGSEINAEQYGDWYRKLVRDEVIGHWLPSRDGTPVLYLTCHVSGDAKWLAPPVLRAYLFRKEMPLVLDAILHADAALFEAHPELLNAHVYVCFESDVLALNRVVPWGILGARSTWPEEEEGLSLETLLFGDDADSYRNGSTIAAITEALISISTVFSPSDTLRPDGSLNTRPRTHPPRLPPNAPPQLGEGVELVRVRAEESSARR